MVSDPHYLSQFQEAEPGMTGIDRLCRLAGSEDMLNGMIDRDPPEVPFSDDGAAVVRCSKQRGGMVGEQHPFKQNGETVTFAAGVVASAGVGDGVYPVYALITERKNVESEGLDEQLARFLVGRVAAIIVDFELVDVPYYPAAMRSTEGS
jgi:hypothetical protein